MRDLRLSDHDAATALRARDPGTLSDIYRRYVPGLRVFIGRIIVDQNLAEDVAHEVMLELWEHPNRFDPGRGSLRSFLLTLSKRRAIDRIRTVEAARARDWCIGLRDHHTQDTAHEFLENLFERPRLRAAIAALTEKQREAVVLRYLEERSTVEMGILLGVPTSTAKTRLRDGMLALRSTLQPAAAG